MRSPPPAFVRALVAGAVALAAAAAAQAAGDRNAYESARAMAKSSYEAARRRCDALGGNARDICVAEAKAARTRTEADAEAAYQGTPKARAEAAADVAEANYKVARERCDDRTGNDKDVCIKVAKAALTRAKSEASARRKTIEARMEAARDTRQADYRVAAERCEALRGDAKNACVRNAKARYGM